MGLQAEKLHREVFQTSRLAEYCTLEGLVKASGHPVSDWPAIVIKEAIDNSIDASEEIGVAPKMAVSVDTVTGEIVVTDNGPGIPATTIAGVTDYGVRTSSREAYISPTRGAQGNALSVILAMPFGLTQTAGETAVIEAHEVAHRIRFKIDPVKQEPQVSCVSGPSSVKNGTRVMVRWPVKACLTLIEAKPRILPMIRAFIVFNPHLAITFDWDGQRLVDWGPTDRNWQKWRPSDPTPAHWYNADQLQRLIAAQVNRDRESGKRVRLVRDFVGEFRGLSGTAKRKTVLDEIGLSRAPLDQFFRNDQVDHAGIARLLDAMQRHSRPVKPEVLGVIGKQHFQRVFLAKDADDQAVEHFKYPTPLLREDLAGRPFIVEVAFAPMSPKIVSVFSGINWSAAIRNPFRSIGEYGLSGVLAERHVHTDSDEVVFGVHLAAPRIEFTDRGKSAAVVSQEQSDAIVEAVYKVTEKWAAAAEKAQHKHYREQRASERREEQEQRKAYAEEKRYNREIEQRAKQALAAERSASRAVTVGSGALHAELVAAAEASGLVVWDKLTVLSNDPYRQDTTTGHANGLWLKAQLARFLPGDARIHLRGVHYLLVSAADVRLPDGSLYVSNEKCWRWLQEKAAKGADKSQGSDLVVLSRSWPSSRISIPRLAPQSTGVRVSR
jgi:DNA topoisomerase VI subunit B